MSRGLIAGSVTSQVRALLPMAIADIYAALPELRHSAISNAIQHAITRGHIERRGTLYHRTDPPDVCVRPRMLEADEDRPESILGHGLGPSVSYFEDPSQSPRVPCPAFGPQPLSDCLNNYTDAAAGHKSGRAACATCRLGAERRAQLAKGAA